MTYKGSSSVERRYAEALAELTIQYAMTEEAIVQLNDVVKLIDHHSELKRTLYDEYLSFQVKKNIIEEVFKDKVSDVILKFLLLLSQRNRIMLLHGVRNEFIQLANKSRRVVYAQIFSPFPINPKQTFRIKEMLKKEYNAIEVRTRYIQDNNIIGGIRIRVDDRIFDYSVKGMLDNMLKTMMKEQ